MMEQTQGRPGCQSSRLHWSGGAVGPRGTLFLRFPGCVEFIYFIEVCLSYFSTAVKRHYDQSNLSKKGFNLPYSSEGP